MSKKKKYHHSHLSHTRGHHSTSQTQKESDKTKHMKLIKIRAVG